MSTRTQSQSHAPVQCIVLTRNGRSVVRKRYTKGVKQGCFVVTQSFMAKTNPIALAALNRDVIKRVALQTRGAAGPSGMTAANWHIMCCSFRSASDDLCDALASCARRLVTEYVNPAAPASANGNAVTNNYSAPPR